MSAEALVGDKINGNMARVFSKHSLVSHPIIVLVIGACFLSACSTTSHIKRTDALKQNPAKFAPRRVVTDKDRLRIAAVAQKAIGRASLKIGQKQYRADCSGTVRAIYARAQVGLGGILKSNSDNDVKAIYRYVHRYGTIHKGRPSPGELVFFHNTYDRSRNGRMNDALTHIGIVERVDGSTVHFIHHLGQSIIRSRLDLSMPKETYNPNTNKKINDVLRRAQGRHRSYTAGELFAGFGRL